MKNTPASFKPVHVFLSCFDVSGDHHAADFIRYARKHYANRFVFSALAGEEVYTLAKTGEDIAFYEDTVTKSSIGLLEGARYVASSLGLYGRIKKALERCNHNKKIPNPFYKKTNEENWPKFLPNDAKPSHGVNKEKDERAFNDPVAMGFGKVDVYLCIDGQGRNFALARLAKSMGCRIAYYFPPPVFIWGKWNTKKLKIFDAVLTVFRPNHEILKKHGVNARFVGHPFVQALAEKALAGNAKNKKTMGEPHAPYAIGVFPGSRFQEIKRLLPLFLQAALLLKREMGNTVYKISLAHSHYTKDAQNIIDECKRNNPDEAEFFNAIALEYGKWDELLNASHFVFCCSGTATLKAALMGVPHVIVYKISWLSAFIARRLVYVNHIGIANILLQKEVAKELINKEATAQAIAEEAKKALANAKAWRAKSEELQRVKLILQGEQCLQKLAENLLALRP